MSDNDPDDGLPNDLSAELHRLDEARRLEDAEEKAEYAHLYEGEWLRMGDARQELVLRGSTPDEAAGTLHRWLITNDGQRPHLRARAERATRIFSGGQQHYPKIRRDCIVHGWEWDGDLAFADWGAGTFDVRERPTGSGEADTRLHLIGVRVSKADLDRRLAYGASDEPAPIYAPVKSRGTRKLLSTHSTEWLTWVNEYKQDHDPLPDYSRVIWPAAQCQFGNRVNQTMVRDAFGGAKPGPRK